MAFDGSARAERGVDFLNLKFSALDLDAATDAIAARASLGASFSYVVTPNVDHVVGLAAEPARRPLYESAWLLLNDSRILEGLARRVGIALPVAAGSDLAERLLDTVVEPDEPITIIGGDDLAVAQLKRRYRLSNVRWHRPPMGLKRDPQEIVRAAAFAAVQPSRFTFICVGAPQQEMIAYAIAQHGGATGVGLCVGAALDFLSGRAERAPRWMRGAGLEWLHRLAAEPARLWRRYLVTGPRVFSLFAAWRASMAAAS
ncbi:MAG TPA: WecB/TagA/CpsF family glycosyltransferase [Candidatus Binatia bacterium]|nr:WecB/TagA/CpsF family glycosyltransferase [Candidatus Binatia bacterium]